MPPQLRTRHPSWVIHFSCVPGQVTAGPFDICVNEQSGRAGQ